MEQSSSVTLEPPEEPHVFGDATQGLPQRLGPVAGPCLLFAGRTEALGVKHVTPLLRPKESTKEEPLTPGFGSALWRVLPPPWAAEGREGRAAYLPLNVTSVSFSSAICLAPQGGERPSIGV